MIKIQGRVAKSYCFRLVNKEFYDQLDEYPEPEMKRQPLEKMVLDVKRLKKDSAPKAILGLALSPPKLDDIEITILRLKEAGAISVYKNGEFCATDGDLTWAGELMANLPVEITLAKLILFGFVFGKLREAVIIAAALTDRSIFKRGYHSEYEYYRCKFVWSQGKFCDFNTLINVYNWWQMKKNLRNGAKLAEDNNLQVAALYRVKFFVFVAVISFFPGFCLIKTGY